MKPLTNSLFSLIVAFSTACATNKAKIQQPQPQQRLAVLQLKGTKVNATLVFETLQHKLLDPQHYKLITKENISTLLPPDIRIEDCIGSCEIETGRMIGADWIVSGSIMAHNVTLKLLNTRESSIEASYRTTISELDITITALKQELAMRIGFEAERINEQPNPHLKTFPKQQIAKTSNQAPVRTKEEAKRFIRHEPKQVLKTIAYAKPKTPTQLDCEYLIYKGVISIPKICTTILD